MTTALKAAAAEATSNLPAVTEEYPAPPVRVAEDSRVLCYWRCGGKGPCIRGWPKPRRSAFPTR